ncbi:MAG: hypothetical protein EOO67_05295 [Microbacterium sp.]|nr:MAG: hypothetical protein EOO67_05295 [Microbacterium sp.]
MSTSVLDRPRTDRRGGDPAIRTHAFALPEVRWAAVATVLFALGLVAQFGGAPSWLWWTLYLACYITGGWQPALEGFRALRAKTLDVDLLMIVAAIGAAAIGQVLDGGLLIVIFATSGALEAFLTQRTADSVRSLLNLAPDRATVVRASGEEVIVDAASLVVGETIVVRPGELEFALRGVTRHHRAVCATVGSCLQNVLREVGFTGAFVEQTMCVGEGSPFCGYEAVYLA